MRLKFILLVVVATAVAERQIKLEDIERDNLLSERRANQQEELKLEEQQQHSRAPGAHGGPQYEVNNDRYMRKISDLWRNFRN